MKNNYSVYEGHLIFGSESVRINDNNPKWIRFINILMPFLAIATGITYLISYSIHYSRFSLWTGLLFILLGIPVFFMQSKISYERNLDYKNIKKVRIKSNLFNLLMADFYLSNGKKRRVILDQDDLCKFENNSLNDFIRTMESKSICSEVL